MATYESSNTAINFTTEGVHTATITKPTGLAEGNLMVAVIGYQHSSGVTFTSSGWTSVIHIDAALGLESLFKIADAGDVAASNFAFATTDLGTGDCASAAILYRVSGTFTGAANFVTDTDTSSDSAAVYTGGVDPAGTTALLIMGAATATAGVTSSTYAVVNNNPSWTERGDIDNNDTLDVTLSSATGSYAAATTTGNYSLTLSSAVASRGYIIAISDNENVTATPAVISMASAVQSPSVTGGATVSPSVVTLASAVQSPTVTTAAPDWTNTDKSSAPSWSNPDKS